MAGIQIDRRYINSLSLDDDRITDFAGNVSIGMYFLLYYYFNSVGAGLLKGGYVLFSTGKVKGV